MTIGVKIVQWREQCVPNQLLVQEFNGYDDGGLTHCPSRRSMDTTHQLRSDTCACVFTARLESQ
jgi:hypothetical protein